MRAADRPVAAIFHFSTVPNSASAHTPVLGGRRLTLAVGAQSILRLLTPYVRYLRCLARPVSWSIILLKWIENLAAHQGILAFGEGCMRLFRPVGLKELDLIAATKYRAFPPRLPEQPIFYPVLNFPYAEQIARDWNTKDRASGFAGFVTQFDVDDSYISQFPVQVVGGAAVHQELWIPAEELPTLNQHILDQIVIVAAYYGTLFTGSVNQVTNLPTNIAPPE
jgi:hypothetical protein